MWRPLRDVIKWRSVGWMLKLLRNQRTCKANKTGVVRDGCLGSPPPLLHSFSHPVFVVGVHAGLQRLTIPSWVVVEVVAFHHPIVLLLVYI